jgi:hypothetical protein
MGLSLDFSFFLWTQEQIQLTSCCTSKSGPMGKGHTKRLNIIWACEHLKTQMAEMNQLNDPIFCVPNLFHIVLCNMFSMYPYWVPKDYLWCSYCVFFWLKFWCFQCIHKVLACSQCVPTTLPTTIYIVSQVSICVLYVQVTMFHKYPYVPQVIPNSIVSYPTSFAPSSALKVYVGRPKANTTHNILFWKFPNCIFL